MPVADEVKRVIVQHLGLDAHELVPEALFRDGLGADSLDAFELLMAFEDEFDIEIPDEDAGTMQCVQDAIAYIRVPHHGAECTHTVCDSVEGLVARNSRRAGTGATMTDAQKLRTLRAILECAPAVRATTVFESAVRSGDLSSFWTQYRGCVPSSVEKFWRSLC